MATISPIIVDRPSQSFVATWVHLSSGDTGYQIDYIGHADRTVQVIGTFGGATVSLQGSIDGDNWATLTDAQGQPIALTSSGIEAVTEMVLYTRPVVTGGSGVDVTVMLMMRKT